jgi:hypothetical protein
MTFSTGEIVKVLKNNNLLDIDIFRLLNSPSGFGVPIVDIARAFVEELDYDPVMMSNCIWAATGQWDGVIRVLFQLFAMDVDQIFDWLVDAWSIDPHIVLDGIRKAGIN